MTDKTKEEYRGYHEAMADILCWISGFKAASEDNSVLDCVDLYKLRELKKWLNSKAYD